MSACIMRVFVINEWMWNIGDVTDDMDEEVACVGTVLTATWHCQSHNCVNHRLMARNE
jgi:hypothetical protein